MSDTVSLGDWLRPALPLLLLRFLMDQPGHGYGLVEKLRDSGIEARGTTVYPHLTKLQDAGYITSQWHTPEAGPARKILTVSDAGHSHYLDLEKQWLLARGLLDNTLTSTIDQ
ncbi:Transcriptional regulator PadR-like family protein [Corynebacterium atrinae]|uniref:PadR family transcriptional regulator n=1 Tax=Corynebacterium atrinae TaxID=1336740 RepID=UPI0025B46F68|nr:helix-turn-helix transcriptional regulator [Corynebacterium atrinae]WJY63243.1 Transcriptional regulator PadR-like family protein [Corynebacterium atrinae]